MKRRHFMLCTMAAAAALVLPLAARRMRPALLDDPQAWLDTEFALPDGARLRLVEVSDLRIDGYTTQARLQFELVHGQMPGEGCISLHCEDANEVLFLQAGQRGPVACINRLRGTLA